MNTRRIASALAVALAAGTVALAGCGSSDTASTAADTATTGTATTATATTGTSTTGTSASTAGTIPCVGAEEACSVKVPIGGGASNKVVKVELTSTNMGEPKIDVDPEYADSYGISDARFTTGGSIYEFTLNAVESIPAGVNLEMTFAQVTG